MSETRWKSYLLGEWAHENWREAHIEQKLDMILDSLHELRDRFDKPSPTQEQAGEDNHE